MLYERGLQEALQWLAHWMQEKYGLTVALELDPKPERFPRDVEAILYQAIRELVFNVVKHAKVKRATVGSCYGESSVAFRVQDEGAGFVLRQQEAEEQDSSGGFGLIALRERLAMLGGQLSIASTPGHGTTATILLPAQFEKAPEEKKQAGTVQPATASTRMEGGPRRVLLVDDHPVMRQGLTRLLREHTGMEVIGEASDGEQAVELARQLRPDVVVMDVNLPRLNGVDATRMIHHEVPGVRVVGLSMYHHSEAGKAMVEAGAAAYLPKDAPISELLSAISEF
jgi:CheY-like chemotaxis protein